MNYLRTIVSGKKKRLKEDGYDLDLSYVTQRIIAMSIPAEGIHKIYRNPLESVSKFLNDRHHQKYRILNLSGIPYDYTKFEGTVREFPWEDHYPPAIDLLFSACEDMHRWLSHDVENVVSVNCRAGKGRTGTLICCYLIYSGRFIDPDEALNYYKQKRFTKGGGVTQPSQIRYVKYFAEIFHGKVKSPLITLLTRVQLKTSPHINGNSCKPIFEIFKEDQLVFTSKEDQRDRQVHIQDSWDDLITHDIIAMKRDLILQGDILCKLSNWGSMKVKKICRFSFNTGFIRSENLIVLPKCDLDPCKFKNSKKVSENFAVNLIFQELCNFCTSRMDLNERCDFCKRTLNPREIEKWSRIKATILERENNDGTISLFGDPSFDDVGAVLSEGFQPTTSEYGFLN